MGRTIAGLLDAEETVDRLRGSVPEPFAHLRDVAVPPRTVSHATLSTFHGCPPDEIEGIVRHLMTAHGLDVTVKLNPTLLGPEGVREILHDRLGHTDVALVPAAFEQDLAFDRALEMIGRLRDFGADGRKHFRDDALHFRCAIQFAIFRLLRFFGPRLLAEGPEHAARRSR